MKLYFIPSVRNIYTVTKYDGETLTAPFLVDLNTVCQVFSDLQVVQAPMCETSSTGTLLV